jgi:hypothetical protein
MAIALLKAAISNEQNKVLPAITVSNEQAHHSTFSPLLIGYAAFYFRIIGEPTYP